MKTTYETGATSHAVNDLILFTDNTRELAELRNALYACHAKYEKSYVFDAQPLLHFAVAAYITEFPAREDHKHILLGNWSKQQVTEFCKLYADDFENWKREHSVIPSN